MDGYILFYASSPKIESKGAQTKKGGGGGGAIFFELLRDIFCSTLSDNVIVLHYILHILMTSSLRKITLIDSCVMFGMKQRKFI